MLHEWYKRFQGLFAKNRTARLDEELLLHVELLAQDYVRRGMTEQEARSAARRDVGNLTVVQEHYHEQSGFPLLENFWRDLTFAARTLRRSPGYTLSCTATLAVGLASMITILSVLSTLLWQPLPYPDAKQLFVIKEVDPRNETWTFSEPDLLDVQQRSQSLAALGGFRSTFSVLTGAGEPETIRSATVTPSCFDLFGLRPIAGHRFEDLRRDVVIGRGLWKRKWQMDPGVIGKAIALDGQGYTIAGVADLPSELLPGAELLLPLSPQTATARSAHDLEVVGRVRAGVQPGQALAELQTIARSIAQENPRTNAGWSMRLVAMADYVTGPRTARMVWMIFAAVALVWLLACTNVAGLQVSRSIARRQEMGTRQALGASALRLFAQTLTENTVLAILGSTFGLILAVVAVDVIRSMGAEALPRLARLQLNFGTIGMALGCMLVSIFLCALFAGRPPAFHAGRQLTRRDRGRDALIVAQVALASVLLLAAGLLLHSFLRLRAVDPGFDPERILAVPVTLPSAVYDSPRRVAFFGDTEERLSRLPGVDAVGATNVSPFGGDGTANRFRLEGEPESAEFRVAAWRAVTPGFFTALGIPLKSGRLFTARDVDGSTEVIILSQSMARKYWPNEDPVGKRLLWGRSRNPKTIVGVVGDLRDLTVDAPPVPTMFRPFAQLSNAPMTLMVRTRGEATASTVADIRRAIWAVEPDAALAFHPLRETMSDSMLRPRVSLAALGAFACIAMITAAFGLYGLISYRVNQRRQEIGVRLALGCPASWLRWGVQRQCLRLVCFGLAIGLPAAYGLSSLMQSLLYETQPADAGAYGMVAAVFVTVALVASYGPAYRASRMDPSMAIRHE